MVFCFCGILQYKRAIFSKHLLEITNLKPVCNNIVVILTQTINYLYAIKSITSTSSRLRISCEESEKE